jgi:hypothetical protein
MESPHGAVGGFGATAEQRNFGALGPLTPARSALLEHVLVRLLDLELQGQVAAKSVEVIIE